MNKIDSLKALVRPFISISFTLVTLSLALTGEIDAKELLSITSIIVAFHFGERAGSKVNGQ